MRNATSLVRATPGPSSNPSALRPNSGTSFPIPTGSTALWRIELYFNPATLRVALSTQEVLHDRYRPDTGRLVFAGSMLYRDHRRGLQPGLFRYEPGVVSRAPSLREQSWIGHGHPVGQKR